MEERSQQGKKWCSGLLTLDQTFNSEQRTLNPHFKGKMQFVKISQKSGFIRASPRASRCIYIKFIVKSAFLPTGSGNINCPLKSLFSKIDQHSELWVGMKLQNMTPRIWKSVLIHKRGDRWALVTRLSWWAQVWLSLQTWENRTWINSRKSPWHFFAVCNSP